MLERASSEEEKKGGREGGHEEEKLLKGSAAHDRCMAYSWARDRGSLPVASSKPGSCIHAW